MSYRVTVAYTVEADSHARAVERVLNREPGVLMTNIYIEEEEG